VSAAAPDLRSPSLATAAFLVLTVWVGVGATQLAAGDAFREAAIAAGFAGATALLFRFRPARPAGFRAAPVALGALAGFLSYPAWAFAIAWLGYGFDLPFRAPIAPREPSLFAWLAGCALGPAFEELLYRERLLAALAPRVGSGAAIALSSAVFGASHLLAWNVLGTFCVGLALGGVFVAGRSLALCIALHAGLNAAPLAWGAGFALPLPSPAPSALAGVLLAGAAVAAARASDRSGGVRDA
jgi:membrane protease YdiL (CAAX protease family)